MKNLKKILAVVLICLHIQMEGCGDERKVENPPYRSIFRIYADGILIVEDGKQIRDFWVYAPKHEVTLRCVATNGGEPYKAMKWILLPADPDVVLESPDSFTTRLTNLYHNRYIGAELNAIIITGVDSRLSGKAYLAINVSDKPPPQPPIIETIPNQTITLPTSSVTLAANARDPDGTIVSYRWDYVSGTGVGTITNPRSTTTDITGLTTPGYSIYRLTVTDNDGYTASTEVGISVLPKPRSNIFKIDGTEYTVKFTRKNPTTFELNGTSSTSTVANIMTFAFLNETSFPEPGHYLKYKIVSNVSASNEIKLTVAHDVRQVYYQFVGTGTDGVWIDVDNIGGKLYFTFPSTEAKWDSGPDLIHVSANLHEL